MSEEEEVTFRRALSETEAIAIREQAKFAAYRAEQREFEEASAEAEALQRAEQMEKRRSTREATLAAFLSNQIKEG